MSEEPIETIREIYAAFSRADVPAIVAKLTDDVEWISHIDPIVPWAGDFSGKERVIKFFEAIFQSVTSRDSNRSNGPPTRIQSYR
jgi:ketosteroid isomerase-like protein